MNSRFLQLAMRWLVCGCLLVLGSAAAAAVPTLVSILQGDATLVRQTTRYVLAEGVALADGDIVETAADAFMQIEFEDGTLIGIAEKGRLILKPQITAPRTASAAARFYLLEGWIKLTTLSKAPAEFAFLAPAFELVSPGATIVTRVRPAKGYELFVESGNARLVARAGVSGLKGNDFVSQAANADKPTIGANLGGEFLQLLPRPFRDRLPARAALFTGRIVAPKPVGPIEYADVRAWLHAEPGVRMALSRQWRPRAADRAFRAELVTNLAAHTEWERVLYPKRFLPKPTPRVAATRPGAPAAAAKPVNSGRASTTPSAAPNAAPAAPLASPPGHPNPVAVSPTPESPASSPN
ncbi:MAG TPA: hypothetical protein VJN68_12155 [Burkholderiaceae bacterium]|nr:hypothetical protein [Burkholderiaceae bacterium]